MSPSDAAGATFAVRNAAGATVFSGPPARASARGARPTRFVHPLDFDTSPPPARYTIAVTARRRARRPLPDRHRQDVYGGALGQRAGLLPDRARRPRLRPERAAPGARAPQRPERDDLRHAQGELGRRASRATCSPLGVRIDAPGGWWDAGDYIKGVQTHRLHHRHAAPRRARVPGPDGRGLGDVRLHGRGEVRHRLPAAAVGRRRRGRSTTRSGSGAGNAKTVGDHDIWRLPQEDDTFGGTRSAVPLHPQPPGLPRRPARLADQPQPRRRARGRVRDVLPDLQDERSRVREPLPARRAAHLRPGEHRTRGNSPRTSRTASIPRPSGGATWSWARPSSTSRSASGGLPGRVAAHRPDVLPRSRPRTGPTRTSPAPTTPPTPLNLYDVSGLAHYELHKAIGAGRGTRPASRRRRPRCWRTSRRRSTTRSRRRRPIRSSSASPGRRGTRRRTEPGSSVMASEYDQLTGTTAYKPLEPAAGRRTSSAPTRGACR